MKRAGLILLAILLLVTVSLWAQKRVPGPVPKRVGRAVPHTPAPHRGGHSLDDYYAATDVPRTIPDLGADSSRFDVTAGETINDLYVHVVITHPWVRDLVAILVGPDGSRDTLFSVLMLDDAVNMNAWFGDGAPRSILETDTPLVGDFRPQQSLSHYLGQSVQGTWWLVVKDVLADDAGTLDAWGLDVNPVVTLQGTLKNRITHQPLRGARVTVDRTDLFDVTDSAGHYQFLRFDTSGLYTLQFTRLLLDTLNWYDTLTVDSVPIDVGATLTLDTVLTNVAGKEEWWSTAAPVDIPDSGGGPAAMSLSISHNSAIIGDLKVLVNITHTWESDLAFWLKKTGGDSVLLSNRRGDSAWANYTDCLFDDDASRSIEVGIAPYTGLYRPEDTLSTFLGTTLAGTWSLVAVDSAPGDVGTIDNFALEVTEGEVAADPHPRSAPPADFTFAGNFPNPFNSRTEFRFALARRARIELTLYNTLGQRVATVAGGIFEAGDHTVAFDARALASGLYVARLSGEGAAAQSRKVLLLR